ncbi:MAG TPA: DUF4396 domain-containing protein [Rubrivivax sp.]|nr:DUF4396 domain-containing protein [Rubrivivax sp.]
MTSTTRHTDHSTPADQQRSEHRSAHSHAHAQAHRHPHAPAHSGADTAPASGPSLNAAALSATLHCLSGCAIGEVLGMVIGTALGLSNGATVALAVALAFAFGYAFTMVPLRRAGMAWRQVLKLALAADTASIVIMELVDNALMLGIPGAMDAGLASPLFWAALTVSLIVAAAAAFPINRWLIARGRGHALVHGHHAHDHAH